MKREAVRGTYFRRPGKRRVGDQRECECNGCEARQAPKEVGVKLNEFEDGDRYHPPGLIPVQPTFDPH